MFLFFSHRRNKSQRWNTKVHAALLACWHSNCLMFVHHTSVKSPDSARFDIMLCLTRLQSLLCETQRRSGLHIVLFLTEEEYRSCLFLFVLIMFFVWWKVKLTLLHYGVALKESRFLSAQFRRTEALLSNVAHSCCSMRLGTFGVSAHLVLWWQNNDGNPSQWINREQHHWSL